MEKAKSTYMKKLSVIIPIMLVIAMLFSTSAYAVNTQDVTPKEAKKGSGWGYFALNDEFGDPSGEYGVILMKRPEGTFSNAKNTNTPIWVRYQETGPIIGFSFSTNSEKESYLMNTSKTNVLTYKVSVKDENNDVHSFFGYIPCEAAYFCLVENENQWKSTNYVDDTTSDFTDSIIDLFLNNDTLKFSIQSISGSDVFKFTLDMDGYAEAHNKAVELSK